MLRYPHGTQHSTAHSLIATADVAREFGFIIKIDRLQPTILILIRHAETEGNVQQVWHGSTDAPLTARGERQVIGVAQGMATLIERYPVDHFYVSPLPRARATAVAIACAIHMQPTVYDGLREFDLGDWEGRSFRDLHDNEDLWGRWSADPSFAPPKGESPQSFHRRVIETMEELADLHAGDTTLVVSHGALISNTLATWLGEGPGEWRKYDPPNCSITVIERQNDRWRPILLNDISHLPPDAQTEAPTY